MIDRVADSEAEMPTRQRKVSGGTAEDTQGEQQTVTASEDHADERAAMCIEEVVRRENMQRA